ncbi:MAG: SDR family oxidoreductase [Deltaproteobacteria bacterium]
MRVLVTGGAGFIGGHLVDALVAEGADVRVLDNFSTGRRSNIEHNLAKIELLEGDVRDVETCAKAVDGIELIFHEAAVPSVARSVEDPVTSNEVNVGGTVKLLDAARKAGVKRVVYAASSSAYGETEVLPKVETMTPAPVSPYAISKLAAELYMTTFGRLYGIKTCSLRYFNVFGPRQDPKSHYAAVIPKFVTSLLGGTAPVIYGDGEQTRDFCFIENVVSANLLAAKADVNGEVVNIACGERVSLRQLVQFVNTELGTDILPEHAEARRGDIRHSLADIRAAQKLLGYQVKYDLRAGLRKTIDYYRAQR